MAAQLSAGLAWGVPVRPDVLGQRLQDYAKVAPTLHAFRMCHRFGTGKDVHVARLPAELEQEIESLLIKDQRAARYVSNWHESVWEEKFLHYEGRCAPIDHFEDFFSPYSPLSDACEGLDFCSECEGGEYWVTEKCLKRCLEHSAVKCYTCTQQVDHDSCMRTCYAEKDLMMNAIALEWQGIGDEEFCEVDCNGWEEAIDQSKGGCFVKYDEILRKHFGLGVFFSKTRISKEDEDTWPRHMNHRWRSGKELKTTLCYLIVSENFSPKKTYNTSDTEQDSGYINITGTRVLPITAFVTQKSEKRARTLTRRALRVLGLEVFVHASQRDFLRHPDSPTDGDDDGGRQEGQDRWPAVVTIMKADIAAFSD